MVLRYILAYKKISNTQNLLKFSIPTTEETELLQDNEAIAYISTETSNV